MDWKIPNLQSMAGWADKLSVIQSSTFTKHHQILAECDVCLSALTQPCPGPAPTTIPPHKSSRLHGQKDSVEMPVPSSTQLKQGKIYVNAKKVRIWFQFWLSRHWISNSVIVALPITRSVDKQLVPCLTQLKLVMLCKPSINTGMTAVPCFRQGPFTSWANFMPVRLRAFMNTLQNLFVTVFFVSSQC